MIFHGYFRSSAAWRCRIAFALKGVMPEFVAVHLRRGDQRSESYVAKNPQALVPALEVEGRVLAQSLAIIEWLDETVPEPPLLPAHPLDRAEVRAFSQAIACDIHPINNLRVLNYLKNPLGHSQDEVDIWVRHWCETGLSGLEEVARRNAHRGRYAFGDTPSLADICLAPQMGGARRFGTDTTKFARLSEIEAALDALPAFANAVPGRQPDAEI
ncbi:maleylacetoacetate isomerase [Pinisolibacter sp.]|uniref:maleylacetoacetate isomerase n=1 Tax=Pinisolibacter sp. TaxID=2172024 RepID=UPI002FDCCF87